MTIPEAQRITRMNEWRCLIHKRQQREQGIRAWCLQNRIRENVQLDSAPPLTTMRSIIISRFSAKVLQNTRQLAAVHSFPLKMPEKSVVYLFSCFMLNKVLLNGLYLSISLWYQWRQGISELFIGDIALNGHPPGNGIEKMRFLREGTWRPPWAHAIMIAYSQRYIAAVDTYIYKLQYILGQT